MLACCSPADTQFKETLDTLRFAGRAAAIVNNAKQNRDEIITGTQIIFLYSTEYFICKLVYINAFLSEKFRICLIATKTFSDCDKNTLMHLPKI